MTNKQLKPCPFCGSNDIRIRKHGMDRKYRVEIWCTGCGASSPFAKKDKTMIQDEKDVIKAWNRRA